MTGRPMAGWSILPMARPSSPGTLSPTARYASDATGREASDVPLDAITDRTGSDRRAAARGGCRSPRRAGTDAGYHARLPAGAGSSDDMVDAPDRAGRGCLSPIPVRSDLDPPVTFRGGRHSMTNAYHPVMPRRL